jgi:hypothetical protein
MELLLAGVAAQDVVETGSSFSSMFVIIGNPLCAAAEADRWPTGCADSVRYPSPSGMSMPAAPVRWEEGSVAETAASGC